LQAKPTGFASAALPYLMRYYTLLCKATVRATSHG
jgi:hypothetical protein